MNLWSVHARSAGHSGSRYFHVIAYTQPEASRVACAEAPRAGEISLKLCEVEGEQRRLLFAEAVNASDWDHGPCECKPERYCPVHRYRWEYQQDEDLAHEALDKLGAPRIDAPFPNDLILSVAGRLAKLHERGQVHKDAARGRPYPDTHAPELELGYVWTQLWTRLRRVVRRVSLREKKRKETSPPFLVLLVSPPKGHAMSETVATEAVLREAMRLLEPLIREHDRLRAALEGIVLHADMPAGEAWERAYVEVTSMAREALSGVATGGDSR